MSDNKKNDDLERDDELNTDKLNKKEKNSALSLEKDEKTENSQTDDNDSENESTEKPILPRKRKIVKNNQLLITACIAAAAFLTLMVWLMFFDQSITGEWSYVIEAGAETADTADLAATSDEAEGDHMIVYNFHKDGTCEVTLGTMTITGTYQLGSTEELGNILSASVYYGYSPVFYGSYVYKVEGGVFTGKRLVLENAYYDEETQILKKGRVKDPLTPYENVNLDERLTGKWYDPENDITYEFTEDGQMIRSTSNGMSIRHLYTIMQDNIILAKYYSSVEESYTYGYEFQDNVLYIDGFITQKLDR